MCTNSSCILSTSAIVLLAGISSSRPSRSRSTRSHRPANSILCVTSTLVSPCSRCSFWINPNTASAVFPSRSPVGSSASSNFGSVTSARARLTRCCSPPLSSPDRCSARAASPTSLQPHPSLLQRRRPPHPPRQQRHRHILQRRKLRQQIVKLPHIPNLPIAKLRRLPRPSTRSAAPPHPNLARRRPVQRRQQMQQRTLPRAALPHNRDHLARRHREVQPAKQHHLAPLPRTRCPPPPDKSSSTPPPAAPSPPSHRQRLHLPHQHSPMEPSLSTGVWPSCRSGAGATPRQSPSFRLALHLATPHAPNNSPAKSPSGSTH